MTERRANMVKKTGYSDGTFQPEALHPNLKNNGFFSGDSPKDSALATECDMAHISTFSAIVPLGNSQRMGSSCYLPGNCTSSGVKIIIIIPNISLHNVHTTDHIANDVAE